MEVSRDVRAALERFGLTPYEQEAYLALLQRGAMTARGVSVAARIPYSKVYGVIGRLEAKAGSKAAGNGL